MLISKYRYQIVVGLFWFFGAFFTKAATADQNFLTVEEQKWLQTHPSEVAVAPEANYPPFSFSDASVWRGLSADVIKLVEDKIGFKVAILPAQDLNSILDNARQGDAGIVTSVRKTPDRSEFLTFTPPYVSIPSVIIVKESSATDQWPETFAGKEVAVGKGYGVQKYLEKNYPNIKLTMVSDDLEGLRLVSFGQADAIIMDAASASFFIEKEKITNLRVLSSFDYSYDLSFAVRKELPILREILSKTLQAIPEQEMQVIESKWHLNLDSSEPKWDKYKQFWPLALAISVLLIAVGIQAWNILLRRAVENKTNALRKSGTHFELRPEKKHQYYLLPAIFGLLITLALLSLVWQELSRRHKENLHNVFVSETERVTVKISERMLAYGQILHGGAGLFDASNSVERDEWQRYVEKLDLNHGYRGIQGVGFSLLIPKGKLSEHIKQIREQGFPAYNVKPKGEREVYTSIIYLEPFSERNLRAFGYDMFSEPVRNQAMSRARDIGDWALSGKVKLLQEYSTDIQAGFLAYFPVYRTGTTLLNLEQRRAALIGWVYSPYRMNDLLEPILTNELSAIRLEIFDEGGLSADTLLFDNQRANLSQVATDKKPVLSNTQIIEIGGRSWTLRYTAMPGYAKLSKFTPLWHESLGLTVIGLLAFGLTLAFINTRRKAQIIANELTDSLRDSEQRWKFALEGAGDGVWDWNIAADQMTFSKRWYEIQGFEEGTIDPAVDAWRELVHNDDLPVAERALTAHFEGKTPNFSCEHRVRCKNGDYKWILGRGMVVARDSEGKPLRAIGTHTDITERKAAEDSIRKLSLAVEQSPSSVVITDLNANIEYVNDTFTKVTGYSQEEVIGKNPRLLHSGKTPKTTHDEMWATLNAGSAWKGELTNKTKQGVEYTEAALISPVRQSDGKITHYVGIKEDITAYKQAQLLVQESEQRFRIVADAAPVMIWLAGTDKLCLWFNQTWLNFTGRTIEQETGNGWAEGVHPDDLQRCQETYVSHFDRHEPFLMEFRLKNSDGQYRWINDHGVPRFETDGKFAGYIGSCTDFTEIREVQNQLQTNHNLFNSLSRQVPGMLYQYRLFPDGHSSFPFASDGIKAIYEVTPEQVCDDAAPVLANLHPDDYDMIVASIQESARTLQPWQLEYRVNLPQKGIRWLSGLSKPESLEDGSTLWHGFITDITEQIVSRNEADKIKKALESVLAAATEISIISTDTEGLINMFNCGAERMLGYSAEEMVGKQTAAILHMPEEVEQRGLELSIELDRPVSGFRVFVEKADQLGSETREWIYVRKDQSSFIVSLVVTTIRNQNNEIIGYLGIAEDITERKQTEHLLQQAKDAAVALAQRKSEFLANMSHEIRTPMNAIIGLTQLALNESLSFEIRDYLEKIYSSSNSLLSILNDILDFAKLEAGRLSIDQAPFDLDSLLDSLSNLFSDCAKHKYLDFNIEIAANVPRNLIGDAQRLQQILINLLSNAIKFTERGQVSLNITLSQIDHSQTQLLFCVTDTGIGMSDTDCKKLFQPFSQVDGSITRRFGGTGLGLAICHNLLQMMGSNISVTSSPGKGSRFSFILALGVSSLSSQHKTELPLSMLTDLSNRLVGKRVLVAEDNQINQQVVSGFLKLSGILVEIANNGKETLALLAEGEFDAVLMDVHMPEMDGFDATKQIRSQVRFTELPIIALTAGVTKEERERCIASGMNAFIAKPINPKKLISTLLQWIKPMEPATDRIEPKIQKLSNTDELNGFDLHNLRLMLGNNQALVTQLLFDFMENMKNLPNEIEALIAAENWVAVRERIHMIKGASGNIGAVQLCAASEELEAELKDGVSTAAIIAFRDAFNQAMSVIGTLNQPDVLTPHYAITAAELKRSAAELDLMLKDNDFIDDEWLNTFKSQLTTPQVALFSQLRKLINDFHYDEARKILNQLTELSDT